MCLSAVSGRWLQDLRRVEKLLMVLWGRVGKTMCYEESAEGRLAVEAPVWGGDK